MEKHAFRVKEVEDALAVRGRLIDMLETASLPGPSEEEKRKMCAVVVVGGGPIGVSIAAGKGRGGEGGTWEGAGGKATEFHALDEVFYLFSSAWSARALDRREKRKTKKTVFVLLSNQREDASRAFSAPRTA